MSNKILLVEDELSLRELYEEILKDGGYAVDHASDGEEAIQKIYKGDWDLLLLDIMLPKLDGLEILKRIKTTDGISTKPVIVFSNLDSKDIVQQCLDLGASNYLVKSNVDPAHYLEEIGKYLSNE